MKKWISVIIFILLIFPLIIATGCSSRAVASEAAQSLILMNQTAVENIDSQIATLDQQLYEAQAQMQKLEQVLDPAFEWIDYQKSIPRAGKWDVKVLQSGLDQFQNDQYQITALEVVVTRDSTQVTDSSYTIKVREFPSTQITDGDYLRAHLNDIQNMLEQNRQTMVDARTLSGSTMSNILKYVNDWKIKKVSDASYSVSGPGLGWSGQLTTGAWQYNRDNGTMVPDDSQAEALNNIILVKLTPQ
jgi:hypothetical protein